MAGYSPDEIRDNWRAVRRMWGRWMLFVCIALACGMYAVGYARGALQGYREACPPAAPPPASPANRN